MMYITRALVGRNLIKSSQIRAWSTIAVHLNDQINKDLENEVYKPKHHPGKTGQRSCIEIPERIHDAIRRGVNDNQISQLVDDGAKLDRYLFARQIPPEQKDIYLAKKEIEKDVLSKSSVKDRLASEIDMGKDPQRVKDVLKKEVLRIYYQKNYNWQPIVYDSFKAWTYLFGRGAKEYAAIKQVFNEIAKRDPEFKPRSFFDFGSGIGTGTWAASEMWKDTLYEYFLVDESRDMNDLSELILRDGNEHKNMSLKNVFFRQFLPASDEFKSHLVLSAFTLNELPHQKSRIDTLLTLWKKCDGYMVLLENGTNAGFKLIEEARDFLLQQATSDNTSYLFAPCPHQLSCPRMVKNDGTPCNFVLNYRNMGIGETKKENKMLFSYVIFKKGARDDDETIDWPRLVRPTQVRTRHTRCKLCTHRGKLEEAVITKGKHSKYTYRCARKSDWGDRLPIVFEENQTSEMSDITDEENL